MRATQNTRSNAWWLDQLGRDAPDPKVVAELATYLRGNLVRIMRSRGGFDEADVDDFTQDALLHILKGLDSFRGDSRFTTWAMAVAINHSLTELRKRRWRDVSLSELDGSRTDPTDQQQGPGQSLEKREILDVLARAMDQVLTDHQRTALQLLLKGLPYAAVAERMNIQKNALYKLAHDAREKLRQAFYDAGFTDEEITERIEEASP